MARTVPVDPPAFVATEEGDITFEVSSVFLEPALDYDADASAGSSSSSSSLSGKESYSDSEPRTTQLKDVLLSHRDGHDEGDNGGGEDDDDGGGNENDNDDDDVASARDDAPNGNSSDNAASAFSRQASSPCTVSSGATSSASSAMYESRPNVLTLGQEEEAAVPGGDAASAISRRASSPCTVSSGSTSSASSTMYESRSDVLSLGREEEAAVPGGYAVAAARTASAVVRPAVMPGPAEKGVEDKDGGDLSEGEDAVKAIELTRTECVEGDGDTLVSTGADCEAGIHDPFGVQVRTNEEGGARGASFHQSRRIGAERDHTMERKVVKKQSKQRPRKVGGQYEERGVLLRANDERVASVPARVACAAAAETGRGRPDRRDCEGAPRDGPDAENAGAAAAETPDAKEGRDVRRVALAAAVVLGCLLAVALALVLAPNRGGGGSGDDAVMVIDDAGNLRRVGSSPPSARPSQWPTAERPPAATAPVNEASGIPVCDDRSGGRVCPDGTTVFRDPSRDCDFFPCPPPPPTASPSAPTDAATGPTASAPFPGLRPATLPPTSRPTSRPATVLPTFVMTSQSPTVRLTAPSTPRQTTSRPSAVPPTFEAATDSPTVTPATPSIQPTSRPSQSMPSTDSPSLLPTDAITLLCSPDLPPAAPCAFQLGGGTLALLQKCSSSDSGPNDHFGSSLAIIAHSHSNNKEGDLYAVVGAPHHAVSGTAYLLSYDLDSRRWEHVAKFVPGGASANGSFDNSARRSEDQFGSDVAVSEDWVAISAPFSVTSTGHVELFRFDDILRHGGQSEPEATLVADDKSHLSHFGTAVALERNCLVVGAPNDRENAGSAYIFCFDGVAWRQVAKLAPDDASSDPSGNFGHSVAAVTDPDDGSLTVAVGAPFDGSNGRRRNGSVYVYSLPVTSSSLSFALVQKIVPLELLEGDQFGSSLAAVTTPPGPPSLAGGARRTQLAIGARLRDDRGIDSGAVYLYLHRKERGIFELEKKLAPPSWWLPGAEIGASVATDGRKVLAGARGLDGTGGAYLFRHKDWGWADGELLSPDADDNGEDFGSAVALASHVALVGAPLNGAVYSYPVCNNE